jgi:LysM repeat protein
LKFEKVQEAPLRVLKMPEIPAVLIETAYISNPAEEKLLRSSSFQNKLSNTITRAVVQFFLSESPGGKPDVLVPEEKPTEAVGATENKPGPKAFFLYTVEKGDTLTKIAGRFGVTVQNVLEMNRMKSEDPLYVGKRLKIAGERKDKEMAAGDGEAGETVVGGKGAKTEESAGAGKTEQPLVFNYTVAKGDTLSRIAVRFGMPLGRLLEINRLEPDVPLYVGKRLKIEGVPPEPDPTAKPGKRPNKSTAEEKRAYRTYRVKKGDTILNIAREQRIPVGTLLKLNGMKLDDPLHKDRILIMGYRAGE